MTNLLPQTEQLIIKKEYKSRRSVIFMLMLVAAIAVSGVFLFPSLILSNIKLDAIKDSAERARLENQKQNESSSAYELLSSTKDKVAVLETKGVETSVVNIVRLITQNKNPDIRIKEISYDTGQEGTGKIVLNGLSKDRESLTTFLRQMQDVDAFSSVDLPVSSFAKDKDISFSMQIFGSF